MKLALVKNANNLYITIFLFLIDFKFWRRYCLFVTNFIILIPTNDTFLFSGAILLSFIVTCVSIPSIIRVSNLKRLFDDPEDDRRVHTVATPTLGGLAIFAGITLSALFFIDISLFPGLKYVIISMIILFFIGIKDDILMIAPLTKMAGQIIAGFIVVVFGGVQVTNLHGFFGVFEIHYLIGVPLSVLTIIVVTNAINFIDGVDGLAATITIIIASTFGIWFFLVEDYQYFILSLAIVGALLAFLRFNFFSKNKKIFMGDTGSLIIGFLLAVLAIHFNEKNLSLVNKDYHILPAPSVTFGIMIIPLFDMLRVMFVRIMKRKSILYPDNNHIHHLCLRLGLSHHQTVLLIAVINLLFIAFTFWASEFFTIRRLLLLLFILATASSYLVAFLANRKK